MKLIELQVSLEGKGQAIQSENWSNRPLNSNNIYIKYGSFH